MNNYSTAIQTRFLSPVKKTFLFSPHVVGLLLPRDLKKFLLNQVVHNKMIFPLLPTVVVLYQKLKWLDFYNDKFS